MKETLGIIFFFFNMYFFYKSDPVQQDFQCAYLCVHCGDQEHAEENMQGVKWAGNGK